MEIGETSKLILLDSELLSSPPDFFSRADFPLEDIFGLTNECDYSTFSATLTMRTDINPLWHALSLAYNKHGNVTLDPDTLWMTILHGLGIVIDENPEICRDNIVFHQGKKDLQVTIETKKSWEEYLEKVLPALQESCKKDFISTISAQFSTTTLPLQIIQTGYIMAGVKHYFTYKIQVQCGIKCVQFNGTDQDWTFLLKKVKDIQNVIPPDSWKLYIEGMIEIIDNFILTRQGQFNLLWWRKIMDVKHVSTGSGSVNGYSGWILKLFYQTFDKKEITHLPSKPLFFVPLTLLNAGTEMHRFIKGGMIGLNYDRRKNSWTPVSGLGVFVGKKEKNKASGNLFLG